MRSPLLDPRKKIEREYGNAVKRAMEQLHSLLVGIDNPFEIIRKLYSASHDPWFTRYAEATAMKMVTNIMGNNGRTWREAANASSKGALIHKALRRELDGPLRSVFSAEVHRNAEYIKSVPSDVARQFTEHIATRAVEGMRSSEIAEELVTLYPHVSEVKARLIARTETSKTHTAIEQARDDQLGIKWYVWRTSEDQRVRKSHVKMDGVLVAWDDPPSPEELVDEPSAGHYAPGGIYNCRCAPLGLMELDDVEWPCKVYRNGAITRMTRAQFKAIWSPSIVAQRMNG